MKRDGQVCEMKEKRLRTSSWELQKCYIENQMPGTKSVKYIVRRKSRRLSVTCKPMKEGGAAEVIANESANKT